MPSPSSPPDLGLVLHVASGAAWAAAARSGELLAHRQGELKRGGARELPGLVAAVLEGLPPPQWIRVCQGPGSFTGIRVGLAFARGFGRGKGIPVAGFSLLDALARAADRAETWAAVDALRGEALAARYTRKAGRLEAVGEPALVSWEDLAGPLVVEAGGAGANRDDVEAVGGVALLRAAATIPWEDLSHPPVPRWARPSYAEETGAIPTGAGVS